MGVAAVEDDFGVLDPGCLAEVCNAQELSTGQTLKIWI